MHFKMNQNLTLREKRKKEDLLFQKIVLQR